MLDLSAVKKIYFIGIGGIGMSAVAGLCAARGFEVSGSDSRDVYDPGKGVLDHWGIKYAVGYAAENFFGADLAVVSAAIDAENPELLKVRQSGVPITSYAELLGVLTQNRRRVVVTGTHGKGSTSGLLGFVLKDLNDSSFFVGGVLKQLGTNFYSGSGPEFVLEGDEYRSGPDDPAPKFMHYYPDVLLLNNLELDHPDIYPDLAALKKVFAELVQNMPAAGIVVYNADDANATELAALANCRVFGFGFENKNAQLRGDFPTLDSNGEFTGRAEFGTTELIFKSIFPGKLYGYNNLAAIAVLLCLGYKPEQFLDFVEKYQGLKRRFEISSEHGIVLIDDYAHHPTAVLRTLEAARQKYPDQRLIAVFEPHTFSRTREILPQLAKAFGPADLVLISEVYPAREQKLPDSVSGEMVARETAKNHPNVRFVAGQAVAQAELKKLARPGDVVVVMSVSPYKVF